MLFSSAVFLFFFLPLTLLCYALAPKYAKNCVLLIASLLFYAFGEPRYTLLLLACALVNYGAARLIVGTGREKLRRFILIASLLISFSLLFYYKYLGFFASILGISLTAPTLPAGISFYTFQATSYTVDVYRREIQAEKSPFTFATYLCLFPQLIAGPIVRYSDVAAELDEREHTLPLFAEGTLTFAVGLAKKVILADSLADLVSAYRGGAPTVLFAWLYAIAFTLEIYFDFSGYSDMAIGLGKLFGFHFPQNFNYPYMARSITEFWRRWHITLSSWFRSYVYIPLGGNRKGKGRQILNLLAVWLLTGLWHGAAWNFLLWGLLYAILLIFEKLGGLALLERLPRFFGHLYTLFFVTMGFVLFNAESLSEAFADLGNLFAFSRLPLFDERSLFHLQNAFGLIALSLFAATPLPRWLLCRLAARKPRLASAARPVAMASLLTLAIAFTVSDSFRPFLYFRF